MRNDTRTMGRCDFAKREPQVFQTMHTERHKSHLPLVHDKRLLESDSKRPAPPALNRYSATFFSDLSRDFVDETENPCGRTKG